MFKFVLVSTPTGSQVPGREQQMVLAGVFSVEPSQVPVLELHIIVLVHAKFPGRNLPGNRPPYVDGATVKLNRIRENLKFPRENLAMLVSFDTIELPTPELAKDLIPWESERILNFPHGNLVSLDKRATIALNVPRRH